MSALVGLLGFALVASFAAQRWLLGATWTRRAPGLGIWAWQVVSISVAAALVLAGFTLLLPMLHLSVDLAEVFRACVAELRHQYDTPAGAGMALAGGVASTMLTARFCWVFAAMQLRARSMRRSMRAQLRLVGVRDAQLDIVEIHHAEPLVYCLPGGAGGVKGMLSRRRQRGGDVVVSSAALATLSAAELQGVLAHEQAHLRVRHDLAISAARALEQTFLGRGVFAVAAAEITELAEMQADDGAGQGRRRDLATALLRLGTASTPMGALGAGGSTAAARVRRLARPMAPLPRTRQAMGAGAMGVLLLAPVLLALLPTVLALFLDCCGVGGPSY